MTVSRENRKSVIKNDKPAIIDLLKFVNLDLKFRQSAFQETNQTLLLRFFEKLLHEPELL